MALTLAEAAKAEQGNVIRRAVIETFLEVPGLHAVLPYRTISGNSYTYRWEDTLPGVAFRGVNESYTASTGVINPLTERLAIAGGALDVDKFIVDTEGVERRSEQEMMKAKKLAHTIAYKMIKGDSGTDQKEFDGLQTRVASAQTVDMSTAALSLYQLDLTIDLVDGPTHLLMSKAMKTRLTQAARSSTVGGNVNITRDEFGKQITTYNDLPIIIADENGNSLAGLDFAEASSTTSIYALSVGEGKLMGIQNAPMDVRDLGLTDGGVLYRTIVEWYVGMVIEHPRAVARIKGITNAAIVA